MKILSSLNQVSFRKTLVANCSVIKKQDMPYPCSIYNLSQQDDSDYFEKIPNNYEWGCARYLCYLKDDLVELDEKTDRKIYVLEDNNGSCLGYSEVLYGEDNIDEVLFLETVPTHSFSNSHNSSFKYIGETLLAFCVKKSKKQKAKRVEIHESVASKKFYKDKCSFKPPKKDIDPFYLNRREFEKFIKQNELHTKTTIELVG